MPLNTWTVADERGLVSLRHFAQHVAHEQTFHFEVAPGEEFFAALLPHDADAPLPTARLWTPGDTEPGDVGAWPARTSHLGAGSYEVTLAAGGEADFALVAGIAKRFKKRGWSWDFARCEACVQSVKALLMAALGPVSLGGMVPEELFDLAEDAFEWLADKLGLPVPIVERVFRKARTFTLDHIAEQLCAELGLCAPTP